MGWFSSPKPDPAQQALAREQADASRQQRQIAAEELAFGREQYAKFSPIYERALNSQIAQSEQDAAFSKEQMDRYRSTFQPVENRVVSEAMTYDSPEESARREGLAANTVQGQFDAARDQNVRSMAAMGVSPDSGRGVQGGIDDANSLALAKAGAVNTERNNTKLMGMQLRQQAAGMGRGVAMQGLQGSQMAVGANNAAISGTGATLAGRGTAMAPALQWEGAAGNTGASAAGLYNNIYTNRVRSAGDRMGAIGGILGIGARIAQREQGGPVTKGQPYLVGEAGPEVIVPAQDGMVIPNHALKKVPVTDKKKPAPMVAAQPIDDARLIGLEPLRM